jgi:YrbI family 3-deoxy-D-manno-octulosonate 8-phosphate phosphatase
MDAQGNESKKICYRDLDAVGVGRREGYEFGIITGENTPMAALLAKRFGIALALFGAKDKLNVMANITKKLGVRASEIIYIGDSDHDIPLLEAAGLGITPRDGTFRAKNAAQVITDAGGGTGVLLEVVDRLLLKKLFHPGEHAE